MSKREWMILGAVCAAVVVGILFEPDHATMSGMDHGATMSVEVPAVGQTVTLAVSGMT